MLSQYPLMSLLSSGETPLSIIDVNFCNMSLAINGVLDDQVKTYTGTKANMRNMLSEAGLEMINALTYDANVTITTPLQTQLNTVGLVTVFMNTILATIIAFLAILCSQLIYSLMLSDVEEKTYEFGMLRALGFNTRSIMITIIIQAFFFAIPGLLSGLAVASVLNLGMRGVLYNLTNNSSTYGLSSGSLLVGTSIGILLPLFSNVVPI